MKKRKCGKYQQRFDTLWGMMMLEDIIKAGDISPSLVSRVIGCTERYARNLIWRKVRCRKLETNEVATGVKI